MRKTNAPSQTPDGVRLVRTLARGVAIVSALYALAVLVLLTANLMYVRGADPLNSAAIAELQAVLKKHPDEPALKEGIRRLDLEARRTFFASLDRTRVGTRLLVVGVGLLLVAAHGLTALGRRPPDPGRLTGDEQPGHAAATARFSVGIAAAMLTGGAVLLILTATSVAPAPGATGGGAPEPAAAATVAPDLSPPNQISTAPAPYFPSVAERRMQWPCFRGPGGNGIAYNAQPPVSWDGATGTNIRWKTAVPRPGFNSPVVWAQRVFLSGASDGVCEVFCFDADDGRLLWRHEVRDVPGAPAELPKVSEDTGYAAPTMVTDGQRAVAIFATGNIVALDNEGTRIWARNLGLPDNHYGHSSSLLMHENRVLVQFDHFDETVVLALDAETGKTLWETPRDVTISWASPILVNTGTRLELILNAEPLVAAYDPATGAELWRADCMTGEVAPSPAYAEGRVFVTTEYATLTALGTGAGTAADGAVLWTVDVDLPDVASPLALPGLLVLATSGGIVTCRNPENGETLWVQEFPDGFYASPVFAADKIYLTDFKGVTHIFKPAPAYEAVGRAELGAHSVCTPAFQGTRIYMRGDKHLYCIEASKGG